MMITKRHGNCHRIRGAEQVNFMDENFFDLKVYGHWAMKLVT